MFLLNKLNSRENIFIAELLIIILIVLILPVVSYAKNSNEGAHPFVDSDNVSSSNLEKKRNDYLEKCGYELGVSRANPNNGYIGWAESSIKVSKDDLQYGQSRVVAFEEAFMKAKGEFIRSKHVEITTERLYEFFRDNYPEPEPEGQNWLDYMQKRLNVALEKALDLGEAKLNELLREYDIDPDKYDSVDKTQKKEMLRNSIMRETTTEAVGSVSGLIIERTFEDNNSVGVLVKYSHKTEKIARQIASENPVSLGSSYDPGLYIEDHLKPLEPEQAIDVHGVRIMQNKSGENVLVAFGQWSPAVTKNDSERKIELEIEAARKTARSQAEAILSDFINGTAVLNDINNYREEEELYKQIQDGRAEEGRSYRLGQYIDQTVKQFSSVSLTGVTTVDTWAANHPDTGHLIVGHILKWSPRTRDAAQGKIEEEKEPAQVDSEEEEKDEVRKSPF